MTTYEVLHGDCRETLKTLPDESVHCVVTSPPYFGLRDYGTGKWEGGDPECSHENAFGKSRYDYKLNPGLGPTGVQDQSSNAASAVRPVVEECPDCGAARIDEQIGLEETPDAFVAELVGVFREIKRVLHPSGTVWLNLGDSYCSTAPGTMGDALRDGLSTNLSEETKESRRNMRPQTPSGMKPKDLIGIPWMVAFALRADGWYLRQDIIWNKPNCMPEPVKDRCTKNHEYIFLLSKSSSYFYDHYAIRQPVAQSSIDRALDRKNDINRTFHSKHPSAGKNAPIDVTSMWGRFVDPFTGANKRSVWTVTTQSYKKAHFATYPPDLIEPCILAGTSAHGACADCLTPWERVVHKPDMSKRPTRSENAKQNDLSIHLNNGWGEREKSSGQAWQKWRDENPDVSVGWRPGCECRGKLTYEEVTIPARMSQEQLLESGWGVNSKGEYAGENQKDYASSGAQGASDVKRRMIESATKPKVRKDWVYRSDIPLDEHPVVPCVVLDPFGGSGTTAGVAIKHGRQAILCELNPDYAGLIDERIHSIADFVEHDVEDMEWL